MYGILFRVEAKPSKRQELIEHCHWVVDVCKEKEPNTLRFDIFVDDEDENAFYFYEAYTDEDGFKEHQQNEPYKRWVAGRGEELTTNFEVIFIGSALVTTVE